MEAVAGSNEEQLQSPILYHNFEQLRLYISNNAAIVDFQVVQSFSGKFTYPPRKYSRDVISYDRWNKFREIMGSSTVSCSKLTVSRAVRHSGPFCWN